MEDTTENKMKSSIAAGGMRYCVIGTTGYLGSWLVNSLLQGGHSVHATVRDRGLSLSLSIILTTILSIHLVQTFMLSKNFK